MIVEFLDLMAQQDPLARPVERVKREVLVAKELQESLVKMEQMELLA